VETVELGLALFLAVTAIGALARWTPLPLPMLLVIGGAALSFVPGLSEVELDPDVFFLLFVPLLLFGDGWQFPKREFVSYLRPILLLALGLVAARRGRRTWCTGSFPRCRWPLRSRWARSCRQPTRSRPRQLLPAFPSRRGRCTS
jgi:hypothetical protein